MVWIFLKGEKRDSDYSGCFMVGRRKVKSIRFFSSCWVQEKGLMVWGCVFFLLLFPLLSISLCFAYGWSFFHLLCHFLGLNHSRVGLCFISLAFFFFSTLVSSFNDHLVLALVFFPHSFAIFFRLFFFRGVFCCGWIWLMIMIRRGHLVWSGYFFVCSN